MIKKSLIGGAVVLALLLLGFMTPVGSYLGTFCSEVGQTVQDSVPIDFEIKRARKMIADLKPEIKRAMHVIAEQEVKLAKLEDTIARQEVELQKQENAMTRLNTDLRNDTTVYVYAGRSYTKGQVKNDLANRLELCKTLRSTLDKTKEIYTAQERALTGAQKKLENMLAEKRQLEVEVENLEAELRLLEAAQAASEYNVDDSHLSRTKELVENIRTRITVASKLTQATEEYTGEIQLDEEAPADIEDRVTKYFENRDGKQLIALDVEDGEVK